MNFTTILKKDYALIPISSSNTFGLSSKEIYDKEISISDLSISDLSSSEITPTGSRKKKKGRPKLYSLTKKEYDKMYNKMRYEENKEVLKNNSYKTSKKYRESYKILQIIYERDLIDNEDMCKRIEKILKIF